MWSWKRHRTRYFAKCDTLLNLFQFEELKDQPDLSFNCYCGLLTVAITCHMTNFVDLCGNLPFAKLPTWTLIIMLLISSEYPSLSSHYPVFSNTWSNSWNIILLWIRTIYILRWLVAKSLCLTISRYVSMSLLKFYAGVWEYQVRVYISLLNEFLVLLKNLHEVPILMLQPFSTSK